MPILVKLYGKLKENVRDCDIKDRRPTSLKIEPNDVHSVYDILEIFKISEEELSHIFVNGEYCGIDKVVINGDRVGLFPRNMALLSVEILPQNR